jgi:hypothetical protein
VLIHVRLEHDQPEVEYRVRGVGEELRLLDWLEQRPELAVLVGRALRLAGRIT